ncbi:MAG: pyrroline-5-carboxylate reductase [Chlamydiia bacterium]|nr:pyrroline-5-carboxylate reductase [Chlamydiia bacterium]
MKMNEYHVGFVGFGHMAQILFRSVDLAKLIPRSQILFTRRDPHKIRQSEEEYGITATSLKTLSEKSDVILLCVRPAQVDPILHELASFDLHGKVVISILAGVQIPVFEKILINRPIIRAMPNILSAVTMGMTTLAYGAHVQAEHRSFVHQFFQSMGEIAELPEKLMDLATALAGSGPAYIFALIEAVARFGVKGGMDYGIALKMAAQTFCGAGKMLLEKGDLPETLIQQISTPNGVTEAGNRLFAALEIGKRFQAVFEAAAKRAQEMALVIGSDEGK